MATATIFFFPATSRFNHLEFDVGGILYQGIAWAKFFLVLSNLVSYIY